LTDRFDVDDRKGLEIVILTALLTFSDAHEVSNSPEPTSPSKPMSRVASVLHKTNDLPPPTPPKPAPRTGVERIVEMQAVKGEYNEIIISDEGSVGEYAQYCNKLLQVCWTDCVMRNAGTHMSFAGRCNAFHNTQVCGGGASSESSSSCGRNQTNKTQSRYDISFPRKEKLTMYYL